MIKSILIVGCGSFIGYVAASVILGILLVLFGYNLLK